MSVKTENYEPRPLAGFYQDKAQSSWLSGTISRYESGFF